MTDRLAEIRARLEVAQDYRVDSALDEFLGYGQPKLHEQAPGTLAAFIAHAPTDIAWLLAEVERLRCDEEVRRERGVALKRLMEMSEELPGGYLGDTE